MSTGIQQGGYLREGRSEDGVIDQSDSLEVRALVEHGLPGLGALQSAAAQVYGCLEANRALVWTVEEFGELAQAVRRGEGRPRLEEELGQLTAWMLCLANILEVDLPGAVRSAFTEEIDRQLGKYGTLKPYRCPDGQGSA
jgi:NTP pyrophosphatase (non-canonical NTP hydrolase)